MFVDSHCHFDFSQFDIDRSSVWSKAQQGGVTAMLLPGVSPAQWKKAYGLVQTMPGLYFAAGLHPWWLASFAAEIQASPYAFFDDLAQNIQAYHAQSGLIAIGECGLDKQIDVPMALQLEVLKAHIAWCNTFDLPIILHCYKAHAELLALLKNTPVRRAGVVHAFSGSADIALEYSDLGYCLGAGGVISYARANKTRKAFCRLPLSSILLETDAPDMPLFGYQGQRNSPEHIPLLAQVLAELRGQSIAEIAATTTQNFERVFLARSALSDST